MSPLSRIPGSRSVASAYDVFGDLTQHYSKPAFNLPTTFCDGRQVDVHETIVCHKPFAQLKLLQA
ncbi:hypothetical protein [uncultured Marinobacter sp.]|uniref:hypothetical protein n=1 Tax=uncultured Marinobacter sp. TaxID=187379 RepID=UPI0030DB5084